MGRNAARVGDLIRHGSTTNVIVTGSPNVITEGRKQARVTDIDSSPHTIVVGSRTVFVNGQQAARITDIDSGRGVIITGGAQTFIGD